MTQLEVRNLAVTWGHGPHLERLNLKADTGEICAIVGASGSGKSLFCELLTSRIQPSSGIILFNARPLPKEPDPARFLLRAGDGGFAHLAVRENLQIAYDFKSRLGIGNIMNPRRNAAAIDGMLQAGRLAGVARRYPDDLDPVQRTALGLLLAWIARPKLLVMDDVFAPHTTSERNWLYNILSEMREDVRPTTFFVTRDIAEAFKLAGRVLVFDRPPAPAGASERPAAATITYDLRLDRDHRRRLALSAAAATVPAIAMPANDA